MRNLLKRLKLADPDGRISITNLAVYIVLGAFLFSVYRAGAVDVSALGALLTALAAYRVKAHQADSAASDSAEREDRAAQREFEKLQAELADTRKELDRASRATASATRPPLPAGLR